MTEEKNSLLKSGKVYKDSKIDYFLEKEIRNIIHIIL